MTDTTSAVLRLKLGFEDDNAFIKGYCRYVTKDGILLVTRREYKKGERLQFELLKKNGDRLLAGEGVAASVVPFNPEKPKSPHGVVVRVGKVAPGGVELLKKLLLAKRSLGAVNGKADQEVAPDKPQEASVPESKPVTELKQKPEAQETSVSKPKPPLGLKLKPKTQEASIPESMSTPKPKALGALKLKRLQDLRRPGAAVLPRQEGKKTGPTELDAGVVESPQKGEGVEDVAAVVQPKDSVKHEQVDGAVSPPLEHADCHSAGDTIEDDGAISQAQELQLDVDSAQDESDSIVDRGDAQEDVEPIDQPDDEAEEEAEEGSDLIGLFDDDVEEEAEEAEEAEEEADLLDVLDDDAEQDVESVGSLDEDEEAEGEADLIDVLDDDDAKEEAEAIGVLHEDAEEDSDSVVSLDQLADDTGSGLLQAPSEAMNDGLGGDDSPDPESLKARLADDEEGLSQLDREEQRSDDKADDEVDGEAQGLAVSSGDEKVEKESSEPVEPQLSVHPDPEPEPIQPLPTAGDKKVKKRGGIGGFFKRIFGGKSEEAASALTPVVGSSSTEPAPSLVVVVDEDYPEDNGEPAPWEIDKKPPQAPSVDALNALDQLAGDVTVAPPTSIMDEVSSGVGSANDVAESEPGSLPDSPSAKPEKKPGSGNELDWLLGELGDD